MKKQLLLAAFLMGGFFTVSAQQTTVLTNDFEGTYAEIFNQTGFGNYDIDEIDESAFASYNAQAAINDLGFAGKTVGSANFVVEGQNAILTEGSDNAMDTPLVTLPADQPANLSFRIGAYSPTAEPGTAHYSVYVLVAADYDVETAAEFAAMLDAKTPILANDIAEDGSSVVNADLSAYQGQEIFILFRHHNNEGLAYLFLDDVVVTSGTLGLNEVTSTQFTVFPNPATDVVNVANVEGLNTIQLVDLNGRTVKSVNFAGVSEASVNVSDLSAGVYMMNIATDKGTTTKKIVKN